MGNMMQWGGPLDAGWIEAQRALQVQVLDMMASFGMSPVLPGFAGHVPPAFAALHPDANLTRSSVWHGFNATYLLQPSDPLFPGLGARFISTLRDMYALPEGGFYRLVLRAR